MNERISGRISLSGEERIEWNRLRSRAAQAVRRAVKDGHLKDLKKDKVPCADCGSRATLYHHDDYSKPLEVIPICGGCNIHRGTNAPTILIDTDIIRCPMCGSSVVLYRVRTDDYLCRRCGTRFKREGK